MRKHKFTFIDLFSGIGGFRVALESHGGKCIGFSEIYNPAIEVYRDNFDTRNDLELGDITVADNFPYADILVGGVPCQSWSIAGRNKGFDDPRGRLWLDTIRATKAVQPKAFIYENVKGLADPRNKENLELIVKEFENINYTVQYKVLNAFDYGLPQSRERIFLVGIRNDLNSFDFSFPDPYDNLPNLADALDDIDVNCQTVLRPADNKNSFNMAAVTNKGNFFIFSDVRNGDFTVHSWDLVDTTELEKSICLKILKNRRRSLYGDKDGNPMSFNDVKKLFNSENQLIPLDSIAGEQVDESVLQSLVSKQILRYKEGKYDLFHSRISSGINGVYRVFMPESHVFSTLTRSGTRDFIATASIPANVSNAKQYFIEKIFKANKYREITLREAARIQGFHDDFEFNTSTSTGMALLGNSIAINIVKELMQSLVEVVSE